MNFEWDIKKEAKNNQKHKVSFAEACLVFTDKFSLNLFDNHHSTEEERWITMGQTPYGEILVVVHTYRNINGKEIVRIISARKASKKRDKTIFYEEVINSWKKSMIFLMRSKGNFIGRWMI